MASIWGHRNDRAGQSHQASEHEDDQNAGDPAPQPTERTRLLPPENGQGYLSPDDPAVSFNFYYFVFGFWFFFSSKAMMYADLT